MRDGAPHHAAQGAPRSPNRCSGDWTDGRCEGSMRVTGLKLANFRAIESAEFRFQPGFNLVVGVNGVGKTSVLDALRSCFSRILPAVGVSRSRAMSFEISDIRVGFPFLDVEASLEVGTQQFRYTRRQWKERFAKDDAKNIDLLR